MENAKRNGTLLLIQRIADALDVTFARLIVGHLIACAVEAGIEQLKSDILSQLNEKQS